MRVHPPGAGAVAAPTAPTPGLDAGSALTRRELGYPVALAVSVAVAVVSLWVVPRGIAYDPWSWLVWGREIAHLRLDTAGAASSVKPLPMLLIAGLSLAGGPTPLLWLVVARAAAVMALLLAYRLGARLGGWPAGVVAALGLLTASQYLPYLAVAGMSEPMLVAIVLLAVDLGLRGRHHLALVALAFAALLRIELWGFVVLYGTWCLRGSPRRARTGALVAALLVAVPALWVLPDLWGSGDALRSASAATFESQGGPLLARSPGLASIGQAGGLLLAPLTVLFCAGVVRDAWVWVRHRTLRPTLVLGACALALVAVESLMAQLRVATGAPRYLLPAAAVAAILAACTLVDLVREVARRAGRMDLRKDLRIAGVAGVVLLLVGSSAPQTVRLVHDVRGGMANEARLAELTDRAPQAIALVGRRVVLDCGTITAANLFVPNVAWALDVPLGRVGIDDGPSGVTFRVGDVPPVPAAYSSAYKRVGSTAGAEGQRFDVLSTCSPAK